MAKFSDKTLISNIEGGHQLEASIGYLYKENYRKLEHIVLYNSGSKEDAQDVIQETMMALIEMIQAKKYRVEASISSVLYAIAKNIWMKKVNKHSTDASRDYNWLSTQQAQQADVQWAIEKTEAMEKVAALFESLGDNCKKLLTYFYFEERNYGEILALMQYDNEQVLRNKKSKCMKALTEKVLSNENLANSLKAALNMLNNE